MTTVLTRRTLLRAALTATASAALGSQLAACTTGSRPQADTRGPSPERRSVTASDLSKQVLLAYFSRPGENYYYYGGHRYERQVVLRSGDSFS